MPEYNKQVDICKGYPLNPLTYEEILVKYRENARRVLPEVQIAQSIRLIKNRGNVENTLQLMGLLTSRQGQLNVFPESMPLI